MDIIISNPGNLENKKKLIQQGGSYKIYILTDFDSTLTKASINKPSLISILRNGNYLTPDYAAKAHDLYKKYHPIEIDFKIPLPEKKKAMQEWWEAHFNLLIKSGLNKKDLKSVVESGKIEFREGAL